MTATAKLAPASHSDVPARPDDAEAFETAAQVNQLMAQYNTPPYPETYSFWYAYLRRDCDELVSTIDAMIGSSDPITQFDIRSVCETYLETSSLELASNRIGLAIEKEMNGVSALIKDGLEGNDNFAQKLCQIGAGLPDACTGEGLGQLIAQLVAENDRMAKKSRELTSGLKASQEQITTLSKELETARQQSNIDPLTGVSNRRALTAQLEHEVTAFAHMEQPLCLVMGDIDHFKQVNDTFGHVVGDEVLKIFANTMRTNVKGRDLVARFGGEEFAIILPQTSMEYAIKLVESIREQFSMKRLVLRQSRQQIGQVTASFGIAELMAGETSSDLLERADEQLYRAKNNGRNRVCAGC